MNGFMGLGTLQVLEPAPKDFLDIGSGRYVNSSSTFGSPKDEIRITPRKSSKDSTGTVKTTATVTRVMEIDITSDDKTLRRSVSMAIQISVQEGLTAEHVDILATEMADLFTVSFLNKVLLGGT